MTDFVAENDEVVVHDDNGTRACLYRPLLGTLCGACGERVDDISFLIERRDGTRAAGGMCGRCLVGMLEKEFVNPLAK